jgi:hypothetical protein
VNGVGAGIRKPMNCVAGQLSIDQKFHGIAG